MLRYAEVGARYPLEMPRALRDAGYHTAAIGKLHYHPQRNLHGYHQALLDESGRIESADFRSDYRSWFWSQAPNLDPDATGLGWNDFDARPYALPERLHPTAWTGQTAAAWIDSYQRPEPFFLKVSFARPHSPYDPPERFWRRYQDAGLPTGDRGSVGRAVSRRAAVPRPTPGTAIWARHRFDARARDTMPPSASSTSRSAASWRRLRGASSPRKRSSSSFPTTAICWAITTCGASRTPMPLPRACPCWSAGPRGCWARAAVPPWIKWWNCAMCCRPSWTPPRRPPSRPLDGRSLLPLIGGNDSAWRSFLDLEHGVCYGPQNHWNALADARHKYIFHAHDASEQLFDLRATLANCMTSRPSPRPERCYGNGGSA